MNWVYGYNHNEAMTCFAHAIAADPECAMAHWAMAYAVGPNYNLKWSDFSDDEKVDCLRIVSESLAAAQKTAKGAVLALVKALAKRFPDMPDVEYFTPFNDIYANEMRKVLAIYPDDMDIRTFAVEAMMNRHPWQLWDLKSGQPTKDSDALEAQELLEDAFVNLSGAWQHPGLLHMYIHLMEMSPHPEKALKMGDALVGLVPDAGHLEHMATHIDVLCGHYENVVRRNQRAFVADQKFMARAGTQTFYTTYICHNIHFQLYGAMFLGQIGPALDAAGKLEIILTPEVIAPNADWLESYYGMRQHVLIRFGQWDTLKASKPPEDPELFCFRRHSTITESSIFVPASV